MPHAARVLQAQGVCLCHLVPRGLVRRNLAKFLSLSDMSHLQALSSQAKVAFEEAATWWERASLALPRFEIGRNLFELPHRKQVLSLLAPLLGGAIDETVTVQLRSMDEVQKLSKLLNNANNVAASHLSRGGSLASVLVGLLRFPKETIRSALEETGSERRGDDAGLCLGCSVPLHKAETGLGRPCGLGSSTLRLHFAVQNGSLLISVRDDGKASGDIELPQEVFSIHQDHEDEPDGSIPLTLDIASSSSALTLHHRGVGVFMNGSWQAAASGIFAFTKGKAAAADALAAGVLCVLSVRDGMPGHSTYLAKTLHLDTLRR
mmetsp:Transcript_81722/g.264806  ORF Transcript_81722/g.264806 Transcript_81722/m.264806 type:complete len:320 (+) Transcript_81722:86-1045(+)